MVDTPSQEALSRFRAKPWASWDLDRMTYEEMRFTAIAMKDFMDFAARQVVRINLGEAFDPEDWAMQWTLIAVRAFRKKIAEDNESAKKDA